MNFEVIVFHIHFIIQVKLIKTRLRSTTGQDRLESLMILSCERDISINYEEAINVYAMASDLLRDSCYLNDYATSAVIKNNCTKYAICFKD